MKYAPENNKKLSGAAMIFTTGDQREVTQHFRGRISTIWMTRHGGSGEEHARHTDNGTSINWDHPKELPKNNRHLVTVTRKPACL